ncbi:MAG: TonB family protein [Steroidobacteraceae bacterium]
MLVLSAVNANAVVTPEMQQAIRAATFEVVLKKPEHDPLTYEKPLPLDLLPFVERNDAYRSIGTAFALGHNTYVTAAHVLGTGVDSQYGPPQLRGSDNKVHSIDHILKFSLHEDLVVFSVIDDPNPKGLDVNRTPKIDDTVLAVGNALGEGVVIRDGLFTSETPEEQDGDWKWIRFSAAASPGNSGGPLLDSSGNVIGIVLRKSQNENLNYSLPIARVLDAASKASFNQRAVVSLPLMRGTRTYAYKDEFKLPLTWSEFVKAYKTVVERHFAEARGQLLSEYAAKSFAKGDAADEVLYANDPDSYDFRLIHQEADDGWRGAAPGTKKTDLPDDGYVSIGVEDSVALLRVHRSNNASDDAFYNDSKAFMDIAAKVLGISRAVGTDNIRVTSLGPALTDLLYTDRYGRKWQQRRWALPYLDAYVVGMLLPTPDGYSAVMQVAPSSAASYIEEVLHLIADQVDISYVGTLPQWQSYLRRKALLAEPLKSLSLENPNNWTVRTAKFEFRVPGTLFALEERSTLGISMQYVMESSKLQWEVVGARWFQDEQGKSQIGLRRRSRPPATAKSEIRNSFTDRWERHAPYDGQASRPTATTFKAIEVLNAPGSESPKSSSDVLYDLSVELEGRESWKQIPEILKRTAANTRILECCIGIDVDSAGVIAAQNDSEPLPLLLRAKKERAVALAGGSDDKYRGRDVRGRLMSQDFRDYLWNPEEKQDGEITARGRTPAEWNIRYNALIEYWVIVPALVHNRDLWKPFLARNRMDVNHGHSTDARSAEAELQMLLKDHPPRPDWPEAADKLRLAYIKERSVTAEVMFGRRDPVSFTPRNSACPPPAVANSGTWAPTVGLKKQSPEDFYPKGAREDQIEGTVIILAKVDTKGCAVATGIVSSSGSEQLDHAATDFVQSLEFLPAWDNGTAIEGKYRTSVVFKLPSH